MLELNGLCKRFGNKTVADDICLTVGRGKILAVLGGRAAENPPC